MSFLWMTRNTDSIDVPNFSNHSSSIFDDINSTDKNVKGGGNGGHRNDRSNSNSNHHNKPKRRVSNILRHIDATTAVAAAAVTTTKRGSSGHSTASNTSYCDEVSVLSLHSAFMTNNLPIKEDAEFTTPLVIDHSNHHNHHHHHREGNINKALGVVSLAMNPFHNNGGSSTGNLNSSSRSLGLNASRRSIHLTSNNISSSHTGMNINNSQHGGLSSIMTFSDKSLPVSYEDIKSVEQSWNDNQQDDDDDNDDGDHHLYRSSSIKLTSSSSITSSTSPSSSHRRSSTTTTSNNNNSNNSRRRYSTQTYSDKGTVFSSIYKNYCDEESAKSVVSSTTSPNIKKNHHYVEKAYFQSSSTIGNAKMIFNSSSDHHHRFLHRGDSTRTTLASSSTSNNGGQSQTYDEVSLHPSQSSSIVPQNHPSKSAEESSVSPPSSSSSGAADINISKNKSNSNSRSSIASSSNHNNKKKRRGGKQNYTDNSVMSTSSHRMKSNNSTQQTSLSSSIKTDDNTLLIQNSNNNNNKKKNGRPPLPSSKTSSSSSLLTDGTTESKIQNDLYRLSLELASTLSNLDFKKLEVAKYAKQVSELESIIAKLVIEKEQLETKLQRYEMKERSAKKYKEKKKKNDCDGGDDDSKVYDNFISKDHHSVHHPVTFLNKKQGKKKTKNNNKTIEIEGVNHNDQLVQVPKCITPISRDDVVGNSNPASARKDESSNNMVDSDILFLELNESHLTCEDLYATMDEDDDGDFDTEGDGQIHGDEMNTTKLNEIENATTECFKQDQNYSMNDLEEDDDEFPTEILDTTVSLIDPREEIFDDDPFATLYGRNDNEDMEEVEDDITSSQRPAFDSRSVISLQWIPFMRKDSLKKADGPSGKDIRIFGGQQGLRKHDYDSSFRSTKTNMTAPVQKSNFFGFTR